jgi:PncC family amidohydrolase
VSDVLERVTERMVERGLTLATAESCTGGMLTARLTDRPGASRFLVAGLVSYADEAKVRLLGVRSETVAAFGAVSEEVVREMADGARAVTGSDAGVAITGIAGPSGGTWEKPVGTVWVAASMAGATRARLHRLRGDRAAVREGSVRAALELLDELLANPS